MLNDIVAPLVVVVSSKVDRVTAPVLVLLSLMENPVEFMVEALIISLNVIVKMPVPSFSTADESVGGVVSTTFTVLLTWIAVLPAVSVES